MLQNYIETFMKRSREEDGNESNVGILPLFIVDAFTSKPFAGYDRHLEKKKKKT
jgi:hypothetical protein